jgi:hypothetical protein
MMNNVLSKKVRAAIFEVLSEDAEADKEKESESKSSSKKKKKKKSSPGEISTKGAFGSGGRAKRFVSEAGARAESDPEGLMKELGVSGGGGGSDLEQVLSIFNSAIHTNIVMSDAYIGARKTRDTPSGEEAQIEVVSVKTGQLDRKNGVRFLAHTLKAAKNAGFLNLTGGVQFSQGTGDAILLYSF